MADPVPVDEKQWRTDLRMAKAFKERMPRSTRSQMEMRRLEDAIKRRIDETAKAKDL